MILFENEFQFFDLFNNPNNKLKNQTLLIERYAGGALIEPNAKFAITTDYNLVVLRCDKADEKSYYVEVSSIHTGARIRSREIRLYVIDSAASIDGGGYDPSIDYDYQSGVGGGGGGGTPDDSTSDASSPAAGDLEFVVRPNDTIAKLNDNLVKFDCIVNSRRHALDQIEINWYKDDVLIDFVKTKYHLSSRSLEIISVTDQDAGVYTCTAKYSVMSTTQIGVGPNANYMPLSINASARLDVYS